MKVKGATDSASGLTKEEAKALGLDYFPLPVTIGSKMYLDGVDLEIDTLYDALEAGEMPSTSQPPLGVVEEMAEEYEKDGVTDLVLITLSDALSSSNQNISVVMKNHGIEVHTTDIYTTLGVEKYLAKAVANLISQGVDPSEIIRRVEASVQDSAGYLIPQDLDHLVKGGRLTPVAAKLAGMLKIHPILEVSKNTSGKVDLHSKVRTMSKAVKKGADLILEQISPDQEYIWIILNARNSQEADSVQKYIEDQLGKEISFMREPMYSVIACHTGMGSVGLQYIRKVEGANV